MPKREFFRVASGIRDHFAWLTGVRLQVYLIILDETKWNPDGRWVGWTVQEIAFQARTNARSVRRALQELAHAAPSVPFKKYIRYRIGKGSKSSWLEVLNPITSNETAIEGSARPTRNTGTYSDSASKPTAGSTGSGSVDTDQGAQRTKRALTYGPISTGTFEQDPLHQRLTSLLDSLDREEEEEESQPREIIEGEEAPFGSREHVLSHPATQPPEPGVAPWQDDEPAPDYEGPEDRDRDLDKEQAVAAIAEIRKRCNFTGADKNVAERRDRSISAAAAKRDKPKGSNNRMRKLGSGVIDFKKRQGGDDG